MQGNVNIEDSTITSALTFRNLVLMNMQQLTNFPYIEQDFDALTDYELLCLVVKYLNDVIANQNEQNDSITSMYESFLALQTYVNNTKDTLEDAFNTLDDYVRNYFDNLDVQDEIDHKLDEYVEDGTLEHIIASYLQTQKIYNTHVEMVADADNLVDGLTVQTLGYYSLNDGGGAYYKITDTASLTEYQEEIGDLYATLIMGDVVSPEVFGAYGDGTNDDTDAFTLACTNSKHVKGKGKYLVDTIILNNVEIECDIKTRENTGLTFQNNVKYKGHVENGVQSTEAAGGKCIYVTGSNNIIKDSLFDGVFTGCGVVLENSSLNNRISNCIFDACFKVDVLVSGSDVIVEECKFNEHTDSTVSDISVYSNAVKITQYLDLSGTNGKNIVIKNNFMYEHGDNPIDCYTGGSNVIIDGNYIFSPSHECIEVKCGNVNEDNINYRITNNTIHGSRCLYIGQSGTGNIKNFIIDGNYFKNYINAGAIITNDITELFISNCVFEYDSNYLTTSEALNIAHTASPAITSKIFVSNCQFLQGATIVDLANDNIEVHLTNCDCYDTKNISRINANSVWFINNCNFKTTNESFGLMKGKLFINNTKLDNTFSFVIGDSTAILGITNCYLKSSSKVIQLNQTTYTPKIGMVLSAYESPSLSNVGYSPNVDFTTISV